MGGSTHLVIGASVAVLAARPSSTSELIIATAVGAAGGLLADVDTDNSKAAHVVRSALFALTAGVGFILYKHGSVGAEIYEFIKRNILVNLTNTQIIAACTFMALLFIGTFQKHRHLTHSIEYALCISVSMYFMNPALALPMFAAMMSHMILDIFNYKAVLISYLFNFRTCFKLCKSQGSINGILSMCGGLLYGLALYTVL